MEWEAIFGAANAAAMGGWFALIFLPRWRWLRVGLRYGLIAALAAVYAALAFVYFFRVDGGGFGSLEAVATLFSSAPVLLAGWIHYLAFDLFIGTWIAERADSRGLPRVVQAPILLATFMFGPVGYLIFVASEIAPSPRASLAGSA